MKKIFLITILSVTLASCGNQVAEKTNQNIQNNPVVEKKTNSTKTGGENTVGENKIYPDIKTCGIITCALQSYLEKQEQDQKFNFSKTQYFEERFGTLLDRFKDKDTLLRTPEYQNFVKDFHSEFFAGNSIYNYDEKNFIWYIFLPRMVNQEFVQKRGGDEIDSESIIQSIKEKYYATLDEKKAIAQVYKDDLTEKAKNIDLTKIDKNKLKEDKTYFEQIILAPKTGIYDQIFNEITTPIWPERGQLKDITEFTTGVFFSKILDLGISKQDFFDHIGTSQDNFKKLDEKVKQMDEKYSLKQKVPSDRYLRHDEIVSYIFSNLSDFNKKGDFNKDVLELRHYTLLQYCYPDEKLYSMPERVARFNSVNNFMAENLYKYSKALNNLQF
ncbi:hypothetical protein M0P65_03380 [Candidatus Gracilibacteria bacterium]|nr:hypothetical protein [Candidatus Gracilibacteria bacterium]